MAETGPGSLLLYVGAATGAYALYEQVRFKVKSRRASGKAIPGPPSITPFLGGLVQMVKDPYAFWEQQRQWAWSAGVSFNSLFGKYILFVTDAAKCRELMAANDPDRLLMVLHPSAKNILGKDNMAFSHGPEHKAIRKSFLSLFTRRALSVYVQLQDGIIRRSIASWLDQFEGKEFEIRDFVRAMNQQTSQEVFVGPYLDDPVVRAKFSQAYSDMTDAFLAFPLCFPGTTVWRGRQGRIYVMEVLKTAIARARVFIHGGGEPRCLADFWVRRCLEEIKEAEEQGAPQPSHTTDWKMADALILFLFASQDASTASLVWTTALMADRPDILARVRAEQYAVRGDNLEKTLDGETIASMPFTRQVIKEILRYRAPAPMVPQLTYAPYPITEDYMAPAGTMIFPSVNAACMQGFTDPETFDPDRFGPDRKEDIVHARNYLVFGAGPHYCVGKEYAVNQLVCYLSLLSTTCDWTRRRTERSDLWKYLPTIYPYDSYITLKKRKDHGAEVAESAYLPGMGVPAAQEKGQEGYE